MCCWHAGLRSCIFCNILLTLANNPPTCFYFQPIKCKKGACLFMLILYIPVNKNSVVLGRFPVVRLHCLRIEVECINTGDYISVTCDQWNISQIILQMIFTKEIAVTKVHLSHLNARNERGFNEMQRNSTYEPRHEISNNVVCATCKGSDQPAHSRSLIRAFASRLNILWLLSYWPNMIWSSKPKRRLHRLVWVFTCQNATLLETTCHGSLYVHFKNWNTKQLSRG